MTKKATQMMGTGRLDRINKFASGGQVGYAAGGVGISGVAGNSLGGSGPVAGMSQEAIMTFQKSSSTMNEGMVSFGRSS